MRRQLRVQDQLEGNVDFERPVQRVFLRSEVRLVPDDARAPGGQMTTKPQLAEDTEGL